MLDRSILEQTGKQASQQTLVAQKQADDKSGVAACFGGKSVPDPLQMIQHELPCRNVQKEAALHAWPATLPHLGPDSVLNEVALSICCPMDHIWHRGG